ncbi:MAG: tRNA (adenosine(37)-N6)-threonylcarbamoyltransferase complex transferase subunit TsaD [Kiritimatiellaeota bacterium]|nr:tRNA (adenosine(37)-N6)-threonylcarbamoyltransferase complex transferase subunit TsaD [Kiritimatiellota bacterium]
MKQFFSHQSSAIILGIETSCDETAAAVVRNSTEVLSSVIRSSANIHALYGGVVPEIASRCHVEAIGAVVREAVEKSGVDWPALDAVAVTHGPGLASSLVVGLSAAKGLAVSLGKPLVGVNHLEGHLFSVFLGKPREVFEAAFPMMGLVVSGGHTCWVEMTEPHTYKVVGQTLDDAAGEAFDKAAKLLGLGYPGGPLMEKAANAAPPGWEKILFPQGRIQPGNRLLGGLDPALCASFSGLKTSLMYRLKEHRHSCLCSVENHRQECLCSVNALAAAYQEAIVGVLVERCAIALKNKKWRGLAIGGGVSLNSRLRVALRDTCHNAGVELLLAEPKYCGDNAAMIAGLAGVGGGVDTGMDLDVDPGLKINMK